MVLIHPNPTRRQAKAATIAKIHLHAPTWFVPSGYQSFPEKPESLASLDDALWNDLKERLDPLVPKLNRGNFTALGLVFVCAVSTGLLLAFATDVTGSLWKTPQSASIPRGPILWIDLALMVIVLFCAIFMCSGIGVNQSVDQAIGEAVGDLKTRFANDGGYQILYVTQHTGFCRPKGSTVERYLRISRLSATTVVIPHGMDGANPPAVRLLLNEVVADDVEAPRIRVQNDRQRSKVNELPVLLETIIDS